MRRRDAIDVERAPSLQLKEYISQAIDGHVDTELAFGDRRVLAVHAMERAVRKEHRARTRLARQRRLFPIMKGSARYTDCVVGPANTAPTRRTIGGAQARAEVAG